MKAIEALNAICAECQRDKGKIQVACPWRSISGDYCEEYETIKRCLERLAELEHKPLVNITNRQWLESLSNEQWAKAIPCFGLDNPFANCPKNIDCIQCKIDWLNAEHKE